MNKKSKVIISMPVGWGGIIGRKDSMNLAEEVATWLNENIGLRSINMSVFNNNIANGYCTWFYGQDVVSHRSKGVVGGWASVTKAHLFYFPEYQKDMALMFKMVWSGYERD